MARAKKRSETQSRARDDESAGLAGWLPGIGTLTWLLSALPLPSLPSMPKLPELPLLVTRADMAALSDRLVRLERRLAEHERAHAPGRGERSDRQSLSA